MAGRHLEIADFDARAEALEECADHLDLSWTNDPREFKAGLYVGRKLRHQAEAWRSRTLKERAQLQRLATALAASAT